MPSAPDDLCSEMPEPGANEHADQYDPTAVEPGRPVDDATWSALLRVFTEIRRRGGIGRGPVEASVAHSLQFVGAIVGRAGGGRLIDLGSGGGLPGLVIAVARPDLAVTLVERRAKRADLLQYGARALGLADRVTVVAGDVQSVIQHSPGAWDIVTARSFGAPSVVLTSADALLAASGWLVVAEPPDEPDRWPAASLAAARLVDDGQYGGLRRFQRI